MLKKIDFVGRSMQTKVVPDELLALRDKIDALDEELITILAKRFEVTGAVGQLKADNNLSSVDPLREQEKLLRLKALAADACLNDEFVLKLFQMVFDEVVKNHRGYLS